MKKLLIKNVKLLSIEDGYKYDLKDVYIENGFIKEIGNNIEKTGIRIIEGNKKILSPGFIDIHVHGYKVGEYGLDFDQVGVNVNSTSVIDAGTSGAFNVDQLCTNIDESKTRGFCLLNVSNYGLVYKHELDDTLKINKENIISAIERHPDKIVGLKARASKSVVGVQGINTIRIASEVAHDLKIPLTVHIGNNPPRLEEVLNLLDKGDIVTHTFHGKEHGIIENGKIIEEAIAARSRGVLFDIGHGSDSFNSVTYLKAKKLGFSEDLISSDLHIKNIDNVVFSLVTVMTKLINLNNSVEDVVDKVTVKASKAYKIENIGHIKVGYKADLCIYDIVDCNKILEDSNKNKLKIKKEFKILKLLVSKGENSEIY